MKYRDIHIQGFRRIAISAIVILSVLLFFASAFDSTESMCDAVHISGIVSHTFHIPQHTTPKMLLLFQDKDLVPCEELISYLGQKEKAPPLPVPTVF